MKISRRKLIQSTIAGSLLLGISSKIPAANFSSARIVIIGGGFAGVTAARHLRQRMPDATIILIERNAIHVACPASNLVITGFKPYQDLFYHYENCRKLGIDVITAEVRHLDRTGRRAILMDGTTINYDRLVLAPGIQLRFDAIAGWDQNASRQLPHAWIAGPQTLQLKQQLQALPTGGRIIITIPPLPYRCPPGPYERASLMAAYLQRHNPRARILLLDSKKSFSKQAGFMAAWQRWYPGMIEWRSVDDEGPLDHVNATQRSVHTTFGRHTADLINVIPPQKAGTLAVQSELTDATGWCPVDPLGFVSHFDPYIHIIGDACIANPMPKSAFSANAQAKICAVAIPQLLAGASPEASTLINHCYSMITPDRAISITGVYGYDNNKKQLTTRYIAESPPGSETQAEGQETLNWYRIFGRDCFG